MRRRARACRRARALPRLDPDARRRGRALPVRRHRGGRAQCRRACRDPVRADPRGDPLAVARHPETSCVRRETMRSPHRTRIVVAALVALVLAAGVGRAAPAGSPWSRISGPAQPGSQLGLARTADGVLHVIWNRGATPTSIFETRISRGVAAAGTSTVATGFDGNGGLALLAMPDKTLRLFAAGAAHPNSSASGINTFTAPAQGGSWALQTSYWGGAVANSAGLIGATLTKDGQPVTAWRGFAAAGVPPSSIPPAYVADQTGSRLATDGASGAVVIAGTTLAGKGGIAVQQILPGHGAQVLLPLQSNLTDFNNGISARVGAPGVYVAYADTKAARLSRYGGPSRTLA